MVEKLREFLRTRKTAVSAIFLALAISFIGLKVLGYYTLAKRTAEAKRAEVQRFAALEKDYLRAKASTGVLDRVGDGKQPVTAIESINRQTGVGSRMKSLKPLGDREVSGFVAEEIALRYEGLSLNELVNLLYRIEEGESVFIIRDFSMKNRSADAELIDATMTLAHFRRAARR